MNTTPAVDYLMNTYYELVARAEIPDMKRYADEWRELSQKFLADQRPSMAQSCASRAMQYDEWSIFMPSAYKVEVGKSFVEYRQYPTAITGE